jgi:hypothetical protein
MLTDDAVLGEIFVKLAYVIERIDEYLPIED